MINSFARGLARGALTSASAAVLAMTGAVAAHAATPQLSLGALAFDKAEIDATRGFPAVNLGWTIRDADPDARALSGDVTLRLRSTVTGAFIGSEVTVPYQLGSAAFVSGTAQESSYRYTFVVPGYSDATSAVWEVARVTVDDGTRTAAFSGAKLQPYAYRVTAVTEVDSTGPFAEQIRLEPGSSPYRYVPGGNRRVAFDIDVRDPASGFAKGTLKVAGPSGQSATTEFAWERNGNNGHRCGDLTDTGSASTWITCRVVAELPADAAAGTWRIAQLVLIDNLGVRTTDKNPAAPAVTTTSNAVLSAGSFANSPQVVDNWQGDVDGEITMTVAGARKGISSAQVSFGADGCSADTPGLTFAGGRLTIPVRIAKNVAKCEVTGLVITDGAGTVALYGPRYDAPSPGMVFTRVPNPTPPSVRSASITPATLTESEAVFTDIQLSVEVHSPVAAITEIHAYLYDHDGRVVTERRDGVWQTGTIQTWLSTWFEMLPAGEYTVGFALTDEAGEELQFGMPGSDPVPGGPLTLTITPDPTNG